MTAINDNLFHVIDDAQAVLRLRGGVYRQVKLYRRGEALYAAHRGGYIRLMAVGTTSCPDVTLDHLHLGREFGTDKLGRLVLA